MMRGNHQKGIFYGLLGQHEQLLEGFRGIVSERAFFEQESQ
jgi:hypothetical protein